MQPPWNLPAASRRQGGKDEGEGEGEGGSGGRELFEQAARQLGYGTAADLSSPSRRGLGVAAATGAVGEKAAEASRRLAHGAPSTVASPIAPSGAASRASAEDENNGAAVSGGLLSGGLVRLGDEVGRSGGEEMQGHAHAGGETRQEHVHAEVVKAQGDERHAVKELLRARQVEQQVAS